MKNILETNGDPNFDFENAWIQIVRPNTATMKQIIPCMISDLSRKFH